jgi:hypothetical protein
MLIINTGINCLIIWPLYKVEIMDLILLHLSLLERPKVLPLYIIPSLLERPKVLLLYIIPSLLKQAKALAI